MNVNKYGVKCGTLLRFSKNKGWINKIYPYGWFSGTLGTGQVEDQKMIKNKLIDEKRSWVGLGVNWWRWLGILVVNLMIIQFRSKLDKFYCIGVMINRKRFF